MQNRIRDRSRYRSSDHVFRVAKSLCRQNITKNINDHNSHVVAGDFQAVENGRIRLTKIVQQKCRLQLP